MKRTRCVSLPSTVSLIPLVLWTLFGTACIKPNDTGGDAQGGRSGQVRPKPTGPIPTFTPIDQASPTQAPTPIVKTRPILKGTVGASGLGGAIGVTTEKGGVPVPVQKGTKLSTEDASATVWTPFPSDCYGSGPEIAQRFALSLARAACYGTTDKAAQLRSAAETGCSVDACASEVVVTSTAPRIGVSFKASAGNSNEGVYVSVSPEGRTTSRQVTCKPLVEMPSFPQIAAASTALVKDTCPGVR